MEKEKLRKMLKSQQIPPEKQKENTTYIINSILANFNLSQRYLLYYPINKEIDLFKVGKKVLANGGELYFPVITGEHNMSFFQVLDLNTNNWEKVMGIPQPPINQKKYQDSTTDDIIFIPGLGFNKKGYRLGYGGGFFDRWLPNFKGKSYGICFDIQLTDELIPEKYDYPVDFICTEKEIITI